MAKKQMGRPKKVETHGETTNESLELREDENTLDNSEEQEEIQAPEKKEEVKTSDAQELINKELKDLILAQSEEIKRLQATGQQIKYVQPEMFPKQEKKFGSAMSKHIPQEDKILDKNGKPTPVSFFALGRYKVVSVYIKDGSEILSPYDKPIEFRWAAIDTGKSESADDCIHFCVFETWSKKEAEFLRESPFYNKTIFDSVTKARGLSPKVATYIDQATTYIEMLEQGSLLSLAKQYGLEHEKTSIMKQKLSQIKLQELLEQDSNYQNKALQNIVEADERSKSQLTL